MVGRPITARFTTGEEIPQYVVSRGRSGKRKTLLRNKGFGRDEIVGERWDEEGVGSCGGVAMHFSELRIDKI